MTSSSALGVYIPSMRTSIKAKLSHVTSSTATELAAIRAAVTQVGTEKPQFWAIFVDSKPALYTLSSMKKKVAHIYNLHKIFWKQLAKRHARDTILFYNGFLPTPV